MDNEYGGATLLPLPIELRELIYHEILVKECPINLYTWMPHGLNDQETCEVFRSFYALSSTCKQMHNEIGDIFFRYNTFSFLANVELPLIPVRYVQRMRNIILRRTLVGKDFSLKIHCQPDGGVETGIEVTEHRQPSEKEYMQVSLRPIERMMTFRLTKGAEIAKRMLEQAIEKEGGLSMGVLKAVATQMNQQWVIAM